MVFLHRLPARFFFAFFALRTGFAVAFNAKTKGKNCKNGETKQQ
jgi:hypothetical protein